MTTDYSATLTYQIQVLENDIKYFIRYYKLNALCEYVIFNLSIAVLWLQLRFYSLILSNHYLQMNTAQTEIQNYR